MSGNKTHPVQDPHNGQWHEESPNNPMPNPDKTMKLTELRGLECFLAEHVMGWTRHQYALQDGQLGFYQFNHGAIEVRTVDRLFNFNPTTDPAAAMAIMRKCHSAVTVTLRKQADGTTCLWWTDPDGSCEHHVFGDTLELAICKAARRIFKTE